jgi:hypothetical protein
VNQAMFKGAFMRHLGYLRRRWVMLCLGPLVGCTRTLNERMKGGV